MNVSNNNTIFEAESKHMLYGLAWCNQRDTPFRLAVSSFSQDYTNSIEILDVIPQTVEHHAQKASVRDNDKVGDSEDDRRAGHVSGRQSLGMAMGLRKTNRLSQIASLSHPYSPTKILWIPDFSCTRPQLIASTSDFLRIWNIDALNLDGEIQRRASRIEPNHDLHRDKVTPSSTTTTTATTTANTPATTTTNANAVAVAAATTTTTNHGNHPKRSSSKNLMNIATGSGPEKDKALRLVLKNNTNTDFCAPLTAFDWNDTDPSLIGTASIDTTCTFWDIEAQVARTQLIAHDKEVYDIAFTCGTDVFASVGADGSLRLFDLRNLEHSTIVYETEDLAPLLRLEWNKQDPNYVATIEMNSASVIILDIRVPAVPLHILSHVAAKSFSSTEVGSVNVNAISWAPHSMTHIASAADDSTVMIWDATTQTRQQNKPKISPSFPSKRPDLVYQAPHIINNLSWSAANPDWMSIVYGKTVQLLRV